MKAAVFAGPGELAISDRPAPVPRQADDVLLRVEACGICGTDLHILAVPPGHPATVGVVLGHELIGRVEDAGASGIEPGQRVAVDANIRCGRCAFCRRGRSNHCLNWTTLGIYLDGGLAPYVVAPAGNLHPLSADLPTERAVWTEVLSTVVAGSEKLRAQPGEQALVLGAGPVGVLFGLVFRAAGAAVIISDVQPFRLEMARRAGLAQAVEADRVAQAVGDLYPMGADVVVDAVGVLFTEAVELAARGGRIALFGMNQTQRPAVSQYHITRHELTVFGSYVGAHSFPAAIRMLESGVVDPSMLVTHDLGLEDLPAGIEAARRGEAMKVIVRPD